MSKEAVTEEDALSELSSQEMSSQLFWEQVEWLLERYGGLLQRRCRRLLRDETLVEDAMQEIVITLSRSVKQYRGEPDQILPWLYRVTTTHCLRLLEKHQRWSRQAREWLEVSLLKPTACQPSLEERLALEAFLEQLSEQERAAILYRYVSGMTQEEIALVMEVSRDQVRRWLQHFQKRGRIVLRDFDGWGNP